MTITRADSALKAAQDYLATFTEYDPAGSPLASTAMLAALVAEIEAAPSGETTGFSTAAVTFDTLAYIPAGTYKLVCIDTPTGGREGS